jgi:hypothetical protein
MTNLGRIRKAADQLGETDDAAPRRMSRPASSSTNQAMSPSPR